MLYFYKKRILVQLEQKKYKQTATIIMASEEMCANTFLKKTLGQNQKYERVFQFSTSVPMWALGDTVSLMMETLFRSPVSQLAFL